MTSTQRGMNRGAHGLEWRLLPRKPARKGRCPLAHQHLATVGRGESPRARATYPARLAPGVDKVEGRNSIRGRAGENGVRVAGAQVPAVLR